MLAEQGYKPEVFLFNIGGNRLSESCAACRDRLIGMENVELTEIIEQFSLPYLCEEHLIIDGLFGSGLRSPLAGGFVTLVRHLNESQATIVSIDVPSGMFCDWNVQSINRNIVHADLTLAIQFPRLAFFMANNAGLIGEWKTLDIDLNEEVIADTDSDFHLVESSDIRRLLIPRGKFSSKDDYGTALLVAGCYGMMGAAVLASKGALRAGAGKLVVHSPRCGVNILQSGVPEALFEADGNDIVITDMKPRLNYSAVAIGPGIGKKELTVKALEEFLLQASTPVVLDADALNCIAMRPNMLNHIPVLSIITPHEKEFDRLFGAQPSADARLLKAIEMARYYNIIIVLKGHHSATVRPDGKVYFNSTGSAAMATPGSGDVLTGVLAALLAQGYKPEIAAIVGVYAHGLSGDIAAGEHGELGVLAGDIAANIGRALASIMQNEN